MEDNKTGQQITLQQLYELMLNQNNKIEQIKEKINSQTDKIEHLENVSTGQNQTLVELINVINTYTNNVISVCVAWKKDIQQKYGLSNKNVGFPKIDDEAIVELTKLGLSGRAIAEKLGCSEWSVWNRRKILREQGRL